MSSSNSELLAAPGRSWPRITRSGLHLAVCLFLLLRASGSDAATASRPVIPLSSGLNTLTLTAASLPARAFLAHRDNGNAHGFDVLTLYIEVPIGEGALPEWQLVSTFDERDEKRHGVPRGEHLTLNTSDGADCRLSDFRLLAATDKADALLILADREFGDGFASPAPVTFRFFTLRRNSAVVFGRPAFYFEFDREQKASKDYCDVGQALQVELDVGPYRPAER
jgi:hypothetical protein